MAKNKMSPQDILNKVREKANLDSNAFQKASTINLKAGKIKLQLLAKDSEHLFRSRTQHVIPTIPNEEDKNETWLVADCKGDDCPVCKVAKEFKNTDITLDEINNEYNPKYPYAYIKNVFTQPEHYILCARVLSDQADDGTYLPKDAEIGSTQLIKFNKTALNNLMAAYEDYLDDLDEEAENAPPLFAIFDGESSVESLTVTCRITNQPYSCQVAINKPMKVDISDCDEEKLNLLDENNVPEVPAEHYEKCVTRIKNIQNYFLKKYHKLNTENFDDVEFTESETKESYEDDDDLNLDDLL